MSASMPEFAHRINRARRNAGLRQHELARRARVNPTTVSRAESGRRPSAAVQGRIAEALGVEPAELFPAEGAQR